MSFKRRTATGLTTGQRDYLDSLKKDVETTVGVEDGEPVTGVVTDWEVIEVDDDDPRRNRVLVTVEAEDGRTATYEAMPPLSSDETEEAAAHDERLREEQAAAS